MHRAQMAETKHDHGKVRVQDDTEPSAVSPSVWTVRFHLGAGVVSRPEQEVIASGGPSTSRAPTRIERLAASPPQEPPRGFPDMRVRSWITSRGEQAGVRRSASVGMMPKSFFVPERNTQPPKEISMTGVRAAPTELLQQDERVAAMTFVHAPVPDATDGAVEGSWQDMADMLRAWGGTAMRSLGAQQTIVRKVGLM